MDNSYSLFSSSLPLDDPSRNPYYFDEDLFLTKDKEKQAPHFDLNSGEEESLIHNDWNPNDAVLDKEFDEAIRFAKVSPSVKKGVPDDIENITVQIFAHLYELANWSKCKEGEDWEAILAGCSPSPKKFSSSKSSRFLQAESNFSDDSYLDYPIHADNSISNLLNAISEIFFGMRFDKEKTQKTPIEIEVVLKKDRVTWKTLRLNYTPYFRLKMKQVFQNARELLKERIKDNKIALYCRIAFYAGLIISVVGTLTSKKFVALIGISASLITSGYMIVRYAIASLRQAQHESNLKLSIDSIYYEAAKHRLDLNSSDQDPS